MYSPLVGVPFNLLWKFKILTRFPSTNPKTMQHTYIHTQRHKHTSPFAQISNYRTAPFAALISGMHVASLGGRSGGCGGGGHWGGVGGGRQRGPGFDPPALHEGQQLVRDLRQDVLSQSSHAQDLVPWPVDVVPERNELDENRKKMDHDDDHSNQICLNLVFVKLFQLVLVGTHWYVSSSISIRNQSGIAVLLLYSWRRSLDVLYLRSEQTT